MPMGIIYVSTIRQPIINKKKSDMAEIRVEPKKRATPVWIWVVLALVLLGVIAYFLVRNKKTEESNTVTKPAPTSYISSPGTGHLLANI